MTRDLSVMIGPGQPWMTTQGFLAKLDENLQMAMR
jgi:isocitrate dehydrogenase